ncbi:MAG: AtpZ/AtpI family protein [Cyclobacteriaceae bacterium]|nr:AtpZ/AtpI family protein [Cyclobacteriaceae bacterium]
MPPTPTGQKPRYSSFLKYSGFAFQLLGGIGVAGWLGYRLDEYLSLGFPAFMLLFIVMTLSGMLYQMNRKLRED